MLGLRLYEHQVCKKTFHMSYGVAVREENTAEWKARPRDPKFRPPVPPLWLLPAKIPPRILPFGSPKR